MQEYIWCLCHTTFRHRQINVQTHSRSNVIWRLLFCPFLLLSSFVREPHQIIFYVLRTILDVLRTFHCIYLPSVEGMMFCRTLLWFWPALLRIAPASASQLRQNTASGREWARDCSKNDHSVRITPWKWFCWKTILVKPIGDRWD